MDTLLPLDALQTLLVQTFGPQVALVSHRVLNKHPNYWVLWAQLEHPEAEVSIKLAHPSSPMNTDFDRTAFLHRLITEKTHIPTAEILAVDTSCQTMPYRYLVKSYISGREWAAVYPLLDETQRADAFRQLGQAVAALHSISFSHFGEIIKDDQQSLTYFDTLIQWSESRIAAPPLREMARSVLEARRELFASIYTSCLVHDDLHHYNVLFHEDNRRWSLATILDFDKSWAGHAESDLARLDLWTNMMHPAFRATYEAVHPIDSLYTQRRPVHQLLWCLEFAQPTPEHLATTREVCRELGIAPIESFSG